MTRKKELKPMAAFEKSVLDNSESYSVVGFIPGSSSRTRLATANLAEAIAYGKQLLLDEVRVRCAMVYAIDEYNHHALHGTVRREDMTYKQVELK